MTKKIAKNANTKDNINKNNDKFGVRKVINAFSSVGNDFPLENDLNAMAIIKGICPINDAAIITTEPTMYFQNLFSGVTAFSKNILQILFV